MKTKSAVLSLMFLVFASFVAEAQDRSVVASGTNRTQEKLPFAIGTINTMWAGYDTTQIRIGLRNSPGGPLTCSVKYSPKTYKLNPEPLQYAFPEETKIEDIKDPVAYEYQTDYWYSGKTTAGGRPKKSNSVIPVRLNQVVLLKLGNRYVAIKPTAVEPRYKSLDDMPPRMQKEWRQKSLDGREQWQHWKDGVPPFFGWMTYEWREFPPEAKLATAGK